MRVITLIYLHCKPELRDEWLTGSDVDGVVEDALPLEQAGRSLVHWWHLREYRESTEGMEGGNGKSDGDEFFGRELERMGWGTGDLTEVMEEAGEESRANGTEWDGAPLPLDAR